MLHNLVESMVGRIGLVNEAIEFMIPESLDQALRDNDISAFAEPHIELLGMEPTQYKATVPLEPIVTLGNTDEINIEREPVSITEEQVDEVLDRVRNEQASWEPVERPIEYSDLLNINVKGIIDDELVVSIIVVVNAQNKQNVASAHHCRYFGMILASNFKRM